MWTAYPKAGTAEVHMIMPNRGTLPPGGGWLDMKYAMKRIGSELQRRASDEPIPEMEDRIIAAMARLAEMERQSALSIPSPD
ncbi:MAG: hypothetical protein CTY31_11555 [Hyphomicrobium sp.]|nr:MAG: hypothetical protein CTY39_05150 [Hyphomicrobium sp.]PPC99038.1 MAG: hypothetical protein CTY31_11555 [Hyphomicrobium sp.]